ncbi:MAG: N-glycosylase/DNA lyase [Candidatus Aenigmarchaeota archaeon]|nr:N-glycosylase/DNA lyase [Candidatus Aenigmarchaeota archaeon]
MVVISNVLYNKYLVKKPAIEKRLQEFKEVFGRNDDEIFAELAFCICTPRSTAKLAWLAIEKMKNNGILYNGSPEDLLKWMAGVSSNINKSKYIYETRERLKKNGEIKLKERINASDITSTREWLVANIKGFGYKEASHFLRNVGFGENLAILDRHILKHMAANGVIQEIPKNVFSSPKVYKELEQRFIEFANSINIQPAHLDLLFWSEEAGEIFK